MHVPALHRRLLDETLPKISKDDRIVGVARSGFLASGQPDDYSDIEVILVIEDAMFDDVIAERLALIKSWTPLVAGFTGDQAGTLHPFRFQRVSHHPDPVGVSCRACGLRGYVAIVYGGTHGQLTQLHRQDLHRHLRWLRHKIGDRFAGGIVFHLGPGGGSFGDNIHALTLSAL